MLKNAVRHLARRVADMTGVNERLDQLGSRLNRLAVDMTELNQRLDQLGSGISQLARDTLAGNQQLKYQFAEETLRVDRGMQILLALQYRDLRAKGVRYQFGDVEFRNFSQNGEDGILWYIFAVIGTTTKSCVEICAGDGTQCNTTNLLVNHGWTGLLFDGSEDNVLRGREFFKAHPDTFVFPPKFVRAWITAENINELLVSNGCNGETDLLSLDLDGVDYWVWHAIEAIAPRVVIAEVQAIWGGDRAVTVPYRPDFTGEFVNGFGIYSGASLPAFVSLARRKGYRLVGTQRYGFNAVFLRNDVGESEFPEVTANECLRHPFVKWAYDELRPMVLDRDWQEV